MQQNLDRLKSGYMRSASGDLGRGVKIEYLTLLRISEKDRWAIKTGSNKLAPPSFSPHLLISDNMADKIQRLFYLDEPILRHQM